MPGAVWLGEHSPGRAMNRYDIVCLHTIVGFAPAHAAHFSVHHDGRIEQSRDTRYQSGANLEGNHRVIAIENEDHGSAFGTWNTKDGHAVPAFTEAQIEANAQILAWAHEAHGIPLQLCPDSRSTSRGLAYHRQGIDGNFGDYDYPGRVSGGEEWTLSDGKVCPGDKRISARDRILARAKEIIKGEEMVSPADVIGTDLDGSTLTMAEFAARVNAFVGGPTVHTLNAHDTKELNRYSDLLARQNAILAAIAADSSNDVTLAQIETLLEQELAALAPADVNEAELATQLLLQGLNLITPESLTAIATAVADEQHRRSEA